MINKADIDGALQVLKRGGVILYPTDTVWGIGCDATNAEAVDRIYKIKQRADSKAMICLIGNPDDLERWVEGVPEVAYQLIEAAVEPMTVIYDKACVPPIAANLPAEDGSLAVRVTADEFCQELCRRLRRPLVSTSANISGKPTPTSFGKISKEIVDAVDYVCTTGRAPKLEPVKSSTIIKLTESGVVTIIRS